MQGWDLQKYGLDIRSTVLQNVGIPCGVGIAPTKTLAKIANHIAKKFPALGGVHVIDSEEMRIKTLKRTKVGSIWGVGFQYEKKLESLGIKTAYDLSLKQPEWARKILGGVVGVRLINELNGVSCLPLELIHEPRENINATRSFNKPVSNMQELAEALSSHVARAAEKLRQDKSAARIISPFMHSNPHKLDQPWVSIHRTIKLSVATSDTRKLTTAVMQALPKMFKPDVAYIKCGIMLSGLCPAKDVQPDLLLPMDDAKSVSLMKTMDRLNLNYGQNTVFVARAGIKKEWEMKRGFKSPNYTTKWAELLTVK